MSLFENEFTYFLDTANQINYSVENMTSIWSWQCPRSPTLIHSDSFSICKCIINILRSFKKYSITFAQHPRYVNSTSFILVLLSSVFSDARIQKNMQEVCINFLLNVLWSSHTFFASFPANFSQNFLIFSLIFSNFLNFLRITQIFHTFPKFSYVLAISYCEKLDIRFMCHESVHSFFQIHYKLNFLKIFSIFIKFS